MELGHLVVAHLNDNSRAIFTYDELERSAAARADRSARLTRAAVKLRQRLSGWRPGEATLASGWAAK